MGKLKTIMTLAKINNKLGLVDIGDVVSLASTAYKVKNFSPRDYIDDFDIDMIINREEYERRERRNTMLAAAALAGGAYLLYKNSANIQNATTKALNKGEDLAEDAVEKGKEVAEKGKEVAHDVADKTKDVAEDVADDVKDKASDVKEEAKDKAHEIKK